MKKRVLAVLLALCLALALVPMSAFAADSDFTIENGTLLEYTGPGGAVTIPDGVTNISTAAFDSCTGLTSVTIPSSVTTIDWGAFNGCTNLTSFQVSAGNANYASVDGVLFNKDLNALAQYPMGRKGAYTIPNNVTEIWSGAFQNCTGLTGVDIPNGVTMISHGAFQNCTGLTNVTIPNSVTSIQGGIYMYGGAFSGCTNLTDVTIPDSVTEIGGGAFSGTPFMKNLGDFAVINGILLCYQGPGGAVTIPDGVTTIDGNAFFYCENLTSVNIPDTVTRIKDTNVVQPGGAFSFTGLTSVTIPGSVTSIGCYAFACCENLTSVTILNGVTDIGMYAFGGCENLTSVTVPNSVTEISRDTFDGTPFLKNMGDFAVVNGILLRYQGSGGHVTIPNGVTRIGDWAFEGRTDLTSVTIPNSVTSIGSSAFSGCTNLTSVTIPGSVTEIGNNAFYDTPWLKSLGDWAIVNGILVRYQGNGGHVTIPGSATSIGDSAFSGCTDLTGVTIPGSVTSIGGWAFSYCTGLTGVTIPGSVASIGDSAFEGCTNLTGVTIPGSVASIGDWVFSRCTGLTSVTIPNSVTSIGSYAFWNCTSLASVTIPGSVTSIGACAFENCEALKDIYYGGSEAQWLACEAYEPEYGDFRDDLTNATIHFNCTTATPTNDKLSVDGKDASPAAYKIGGANYFKLRDVAMLLSGTKAQFEISYDNEKKAINISTGRPYTPQGYELQAMPAGSTPAETSGDAVYVNGVKVDLTAYKIGGANFYGIRELAQKLGFNVGWTNERGMFIESDKPYTDAD